MDNDKKTKVVKFLKIMTAYFGLYFFHFVIFPHSPFYSDSIYDRVTRILMCLLFPLVDIIKLKSNILFGTAGICLYNLCTYIYNANAAYGIGRAGFFMTGDFKEEYLLSYLQVTLIIYVIDYSIIYTIVFIIRKIREYLKKKEEERWNS